MTPVRDVLYLLPGQVDGLADCIDNNKIIAQAVHFGERQFHRARVRAARKFASKSKGGENSRRCIDVGNFRVNQLTPSMEACAGAQSGVLTVRETGLAPLAEVLGRYGIVCELLENGESIPGSFWGDSEAGLIANRLLVRGDTPVHSALHEACHYVCMTAERRRRLDTDAGGDYDEENGVCYLQILLAACVPAVGSERLMQDMDAWGYSFRRGSARAWFEQDAEDARQWLIGHRLITCAGRPTWKVRGGAFS